MKKGLIAENVETEYFHREISVWLQWIDSVWSELSLYNCLCWKLELP